jgi:release factor glutamine methyltransferase
MRLSVGEAVLKTTEYLNRLGVSSARLEAELLLAFVLGWQRIKLYQDWDCPLQPEEIEKYREVLRRRALREPMAYITGTKPFLQWEFSVNRSVLIPRPETEDLVEVALTALERYGDIGKIRCADLGTGSGIIALSLAKLRPELRIDAFDISPEALTVAKENGNHLKVSSSIRFILGDFGRDLITNAPAGGYHLIVSNPPYIPTGNLKKLSTEVQKEPVLALDGGEDGLDSYRAILKAIPGSLQVGGDLVLEHGYDQAKELTRLLLDAGFREVHSHKDLAGLDRVLWGEGYGES